MMSTLLMIGVDWFYVLDVYKFVREIKIAIKSTRSIWAVMRMYFASLIFILIRLTRAVNHVTLIVKCAIYKFVVYVNQIIIIHKISALSVIKLIVRFQLIVISLIIIAYHVLRIANLANNMMVC